MATTINAGTASGGAAISADTTGILQLQSGSTPTTAVTIDASGNVGIGTSSPAYKLDVNGAIKVSGDGSSVALYTPADQALRQTGASGGTWYFDVATGGATNGSFVWRSSNSYTERMRIDSSGNVGIGVTPFANTLSKSLDLVGGGGLWGYNTTGMFVTSNVYYDSVWKYKATGAAAVYYQAVGGHQWYTVASGTAGTTATLAEVMRTDTSGNFMVGVSSAEARVTIGGSAATAASSTICRIGNLDYTTNTVLSVAPGVVNFDAPGVIGGRLKITSDGYLCVGVASAGWGIVGSVNALGYAARAGQTGGFSGNGFNINWTGSAQLWIDTTNLGTITVSSDYRIKRNIETQTVPALERVMALRPVTYQMADYKDGLFKASDDIKEGFIAHEVQEVIPSGVDGVKDDENQIQSLRVDAILAVAVKAIQEQQALITDLTTRLSALENK